MEEGRREPGRWPRQGLRQSRLPAAAGLGELPELETTQAGAPLPGRAAVGRGLGFRHRSEEALKAKEAILGADG